MEERPVTAQWSRARSTSIYCLPPTTPTQDHPPILANQLPHHWQLFSKLSRWTASLSTASSGPGTPGPSPTLQHKLTPARYNDSLVNLQQTLEYSHSTPSRTIPLSSPRSVTLYLFNSEKSDCHQVAREISDHLSSSSPTFVNVSFEDIEELRSQLDFKVKVVYFDLYSSVVQLIVPPIGHDLLAAMLGEGLSEGVKKVNDSPAWEMIPRGSCLNFFNRLIEPTAPHFLDLIVIGKEFDYSLSSPPYALRRKIRLDDRIDPPETQVGIALDRLDDEVKSEGRSGGEGRGGGEGDEWERHLDEREGEDGQIVETQPVLVDGDMLPEVAVEVGGAEPMRELRTDADIALSPQSAGLQAMILANIEEIDPSRPYSRPPRIRITVNIHPTLLPLYSKLDTQVAIPRKSKTAPPIPTNSTYSTKHRYYQSTRGAATIVPLPKSEDNKVVNQLHPPIEVEEVEDATFVQVLELEWVADQPPPSGFFLPFGIFYRENSETRLPADISSMPVEFKWAKLMKMGTSLTEVWLAEGGRLAGKRESKRRLNEAVETGDYDALKDGSVEILSSKHKVAKKE